MKHGAPIEPGHILNNDATVIAVTEKEVYAAVLCLRSWVKEQKYVTWEYRLDQRGGTYDGHYFDDFFKAVEDYKERIGRLT
uniref:Uncharacterized protein n=1 Tax=viral metagenome TaxID=1070528 RepID=A0A6M3LIM8_9ZZZZ